MPTPAPAIVIDMGTATKFDIITAAGELCGGVIVPGLRLAADSLTQRAAQLRGVALEAPPQVIGRNTVHAIQSGLIFGYVSLIEGMVARLTAAHPIAILTGNGRCKSSAPAARLTWWLPTSPCWMWLTPG
jgi:pantothenate kinase type III